MDEHTQPPPFQDPQSIESPVVDPGELRSAREVLLQLTKTSKTLKIYLPNNPVYQKFLQELQNRMDRHLQDYEILKLKIRQNELYYRGVSVYENSNRLESLAFKLYVDGIRDLTFEEGVDRDEITGLLEIIGRDYDPSNPDDDMVTLLWERRFKHIQYIVVDDFIQETENPVKDLDPAVLGQMAMKEKTQTGAVITAEGPSGPEWPGLPTNDSGAVILSLSEDEVTLLKHQMKMEENINPVSILVNILSLILRVEKEDGAFVETIEILDNVLETLMLRGDFGHVTVVLALYRELSDPQQNLSDVQIQRLSQGIDQAGDSRRFKDMEPVLNQWSSGRTEDLLKFLKMLNSNAVVSLVDLLGRLTQMRIRRLVCEALIHLGKDNIGPMIQRMDDPRWFMVRNMVYILGKIGNERATDKFPKILKHRDMRVRKELVVALEGWKNSNRAREILKRMLDDPESAIRIQAIRSLAKQGYEGALAPLEKMIDGPNFLAKDLYEKKEIFEALGRLGGNKVVSRMQKLIRKGGASWFKKAASEEMGVCAVMALRRVATREAEAAIRAGNESSSKVIREACQRALGELGRAREDVNG